jgi:hypothetical protein
MTSRRLRPLWFVVPFLAAYGVLLLLVATTPAMAQAATSSAILSFKGVGAVRIGMNLARVEKALGYRLLPRSTTPFTEECWETIKAQGLEDGLQYTFSRRKLVRIDVYAIPDVPPPQVRTAKGIRIGSSDSDIRQAYGRAVSVLPDPYDPGGHDAFLMRVRNASNTESIVFEIADHRVIRIRVGTNHFVSMWEGCA